jgi:hypothetical protein
MSFYFYKSLRKKVTYLDKDPLFLNRLEHNLVLLISSCRPGIKVLVNIFSS